MKKILSILSIGFICLSCSKPSPENVSTDFYNYMNKGEYEKAKELCVPSTGEEVDKIKNISEFKVTGDSVPFKLMDIEKPEKPKEGDTTKVHYKNGEYNGILQLVFYNDKWMVKSFVGLIPIEIESYELFVKDDQTSLEKFYQKFKGIRFRIKNCVPFESNVFGGFDIKNNTLYYIEGNSEKPFSYTFKITSFNLCNKKVNTKIVSRRILSKFEDRSVESQLESLYHFETLSFSSGASDNKLHWNHFSYGLVDFEGVFIGADNENDFCFVDCVNFRIKKCEELKNQ